LISGVTKRLSWGEGGPFTNTQKMRNESASESGHWQGTKTKSQQNSPNTSEKGKTQQPTENQKNTEYTAYRHTNQMVANFLI